MLAPSFSGVAYAGRTDTTGPASSAPPTSTAARDRLRCFPKRIESEAFLFIVDFLPVESAISGVS